MLVSGAQPQPGGAEPTAREPNRPQKVPFFSQAESFARHWPLIEAYVGEVFENGKFSHGRQVARLEEELARYTGARHVVGVNSGTDALVLLLRACGLRPADRVLVPAYSFIATATSVVLAGGIPEFVDIDPVTYAMDVSALERSVAGTAGGRAGGTARFVMPVHLFHQMADMPGVLEIAARHGLTVVEDSAEGIGMRQHGVHAGLHGRGGVLSFFPSKTLGAIGDAGAILTDDPQMAELVAAMRHHGRLGRTLDNFPGISNETAVVGVNSKMDDIQAAVLRAKLTTLDADITRRAQLAQAYTERLRDLPGVLRVPEVVDRGPGSKAVFYVYLIEVRDRDDLVAHLTRHGIGTEVYYPVPLHRQPCFADLGYADGDFPNAEAASRRAVALPFYPDLRPDQLDQVCEAIAGFFTRRAA